jgi:hypothetical protein
MSAERLAQLTDDDLGGVLHDLDLAWPGQPDIASAVTREIERAAGRPRRPRWAIVLIAAAIALALAAAAALGAKLIHIGGIALVPVPTVSLPPATVAPGDLGRPVSPATAKRVLGTALPIPEALGEPDLLWLERDITSFTPLERRVVVAMAWRPRPGLPAIPVTRFGATLFVFRGDDIVAIKRIGAPFATLAQHEAAWIDTPHELDLLVHGDLRTFRVDGNVLIWQRGPLTLRLETALPRAAAVSLAFEPGT